MTGCFQRIFVLAVAGGLAAQMPSRANAADTALTKYAVLEGNVAYLQVGQVESNLAAEIRAARSALMFSNKVAGTVLDLRFAGGDDAAAAQAVEKQLSAEKLPLAILINRETRDAAATLAADLHEARAGLIFGSETGPVQTNSAATLSVRPDIAVAIGAEDEHAFMKNPFVLMDTNQMNSPVATNGFLPSVDYTSEADLVRARIKDGDQEANPSPPRRTGPQARTIRDPVLARAVDLIKGLAIVRASGASGS
ncbi:MAG TPA: hypothetical protein VFY06_02185 [Verrucomicrobiae bacterium]|nr:hypothetical protein [Verrucomicrobiae bacterium]